MRMVDEGAFEEREREDQDFDYLGNGESLRVLGFVEVERVSTNLRVAAAVSEAHTRAGLWVKCYTLKKYIC